jgi:hypothetical protein
MIRPEDRLRLQPFLLSGERLLWTGRPKRGFSFQLGDLWSLAVFGAWIGVNLLLGGLLDGPLGGWPLDPATIGFSVGVIFLAGTRLYEPWMKRSFLYALTDRRVIILSGRFRPELRSHDLGWLPMLILEQESRDRATILMGESDAPRGWLEFEGRDAFKGFRFFRIERPAFVYDLICRVSRDRRAELNRVSSDPLIG